jgi:serine/threonine-protein kinase
LTDLKDDLQSALGSAYSLERELGGGGMSRVFVADEVALGRKVVVKVLPWNVSEGVSAERFAREITMAARLQQANIVPLLSAGQADHLPFYTMPFVEGQSLRDRVKREGTLSIGDTIGILRDIARALAYAHEKGVVHRDIKPENVLISGEAAVVTDFGIAKAISVAREEQGEGLTQAGTSIGTPAYMAPEQAAGDPATDHRADIYSFGCVAYELLAGHPPFTGRSSHQLVRAHMTETPRPIDELRPDVSFGLAELVMRCLEKEPERRPQTARDVLQQLDGVTAASGITARPPAPIAPRAPKRYGRQWLTIGLLFAAGAIGTFVALRLRRPRSDAPRVALFARRQRFGLAVPGRRHGG